MSNRGSVEVKKSVPVVSEVDVLVVGSGIAGSTAAVTAARNGARTMLVDRFGYPGGNMGPGLIGGGPNLELPESMVKNGLPGIPGEFVRRCERYCNARLMNHYFRDSQVISYVWLKMMQESRVQLMFNTYAADPIMEDNKVIGLLVENKSGTQAIKAKVVIDATGDADVAFRAGAPVDNGSSLFHAGVYFAMANVNIDKYEEEVLKKEPTAEDLRWVENLDPVVGKRMEHLRPLIPYYRKAWESGEYKFIQNIDNQWSILCDHGIFRSVSGVQYVPDPLRKGKYGILGALVGVWGPRDRKDVETSGSASVMNKLEVASRIYIFQTAQFLRKYMPGFEESYLHFVAPYFHARGGRSIVSEYSLTMKDVEKEQRQDDVIFVADRRSSYYGGVTAAECYGYTPERTFDFPYRQLLPGKIDGLLAAGRSAIIQPPVTRVRWMVFLMGQAAGAAAALAVKKGVSPRELNVRELQSLLYNKYQVPFGDKERLQELGIS
ncbi:MAG: FAD-dependent oxidoreductase [Deltaproteobacteria bacterium]|nr:FAD-dependent oxidoreductase [Deltaproteobacteria bacterium]